MAKTHIYVFNGSIAPPNGFALDFQTMRIHSMQQHTDITSYQGTIFGIDLGSGTEKLDFGTTGFPYKGITAGTGGANSSSPFIGSMNGTAGALGSATTFTVDTLCTIATTATGVDGAMAHSRLIAGAQCSLEFVITQDATVAWATT
jgi:hypothetical protein